MPFLLDTNIVSDLVRHAYGRVAEHIARVGQENVYTSIIVAAELRFGGARKNSASLTSQIEKVLGGMEILPFEAPADRDYARLRADLEKKGQTISANDMLIAAHALALGYTLVTDNVSEFARIRALSIENWLG